MLVFIAFTLLQLLSIRGELVEEMVNNIRLENFNSKGIGQFLGVSLYLYIECEDGGISVNIDRYSSKYKSKDAIYIYIYIRDVEELENVLMYQYKDETYCF